MKYNKVRIGDCCTIEKKSISPQKGIYYSCFSLPAFDNQKTPEYIDGSAIKSSKYILENNTILFNKLNPKFRRVWNIHSLENYDNPICSTEFLPLKCNENINQDYLYYYISSPQFTQLMDGIKTGTSNSQQRIDWKLFLNQMISLPNLELQTKISSMLKIIDEKIELNAEINKNLSYHKKAKSKKNRAFVKI